LLVNERGGEWHAALHPVYSVTEPERRTAMIHLLMMVEHESE
jgi:hypothetical protein